MASIKANENAQIKVSFDDSEQMILHEWTEYFANLGTSSGALYPTIPDY